MTKKINKLKEKSDVSLLHLKSYLLGNIYFVHTLYICQLVIRLHHLYIEPTLVIGKKK